MADEHEKDQQQLPTTQQQVKLPSVWQTSAQGLENRRISQQNLSLKHGMFASVPIICKGQQCPYFQTCWIPEADLQIGERCPIEIAAIIERFDSYCEELGVNVDDNIVDAGYVKEIVDIEVMMLRADSLLAISGSFIEDVVAGISPKGQEYYKPEISKAAEFKQTLRTEKNKLFNHLNASRKDRKDGTLDDKDPSSVAARIIAKVKDFQNKGIIIDAETMDIDDIKSEVKNHDEKNHEKPSDQ